MSLHYLMNPEIVSFQYATGMCLLLENVGGCVHAGRPEVATFEHLQLTGSVQSHPHFSRRRFGGPVPPWPQRRTATAGIIHLVLFHNSVRIDRLPQLTGARVVIVTVTYHHFNITVFSCSFIVLVVGCVDNRPNCRIE